MPNTYSTVNFHEMIAIELDELNDLTCALTPALVKNDLDAFLSIYYCVQEKISNLEYQVKSFKPARTLKLIKT